MAETDKTKGLDGSVDYLVKGVLSRVGDLVDRMTGRSWRPSSSLATSELIERLKAILDDEAVTLDGNKWVPHHLKLNLQWDKFSLDSDEAIKKLHDELLIAVIDHVNDCHYLTRGPVEIEIRADYFARGIVISASFEKNAADVKEEVIEQDSLSISHPAETNNHPPDESLGKELRFKIKTSEKTTNEIIKISPKQRISVGRTSDNDLVLPDSSVSKAHAAIRLTQDGKLLIADLGSSNGTFVSGVRIPYGKSMEISPSTLLKFGAVEVEFDIY
ncbi:MAG TPA: FHA domain-containing protein [Pyrinomonadaceae bacterium]|nr:FHA domain-containing protein [Pyrinomonadaceae bacterium]